jgi:protein SCO1/2
VARLGALILAALLAMPLTAEAALPVGSFAGLAFAQHPGVLLPLNTALKDANGRKVRLGDYFGALPVILVLEYFHCPSLCGVTMDSLYAGLDRSGLVPGRDYALVAISFDPRETVSDAAEAERQGVMRTAYGRAAAGAWHYLLGQGDDVKRLAATVGFPYRFDASIGQFAHPAGIMLITPQGRVSRYLLGVSYPAGALVRGLADASHETVADAAPPLLLLCYHYDPATGTYTLAIYRLIQIAAAGMVVAVAAGLLVLRLRERRRV